MSDTIDEIDDEQTKLDKSTSVQLLADADWKIRSDGRTVEGRIVPFNEPTLIVEKGQRFREQFLPGCLTRLIQLISGRGNAGWINFNLDHDESFDGRIGYVRSIEQRDDGGWSTMRLLPSRDLEKVHAMLEETHRGLSVMFDDVAPPRLIGGVRSRVQIAIRHVAATPWAAYDGAAIASIRSESTETLTLDEIADRPALREWQSYLDSLTPTRTL